MTSAIAGVLAGKVFLVTGGARGLGLAICQMLVREGAAVALADINAEAASAAASRWGAGRVHGLGLGVGDEQSARQSVKPRGFKVSAVIAGGMRTPFLLDRFPDLDPEILQDPANVADTVRFVLTQPAKTVIPEVMVLPMKETSWP